MDFQPGVEQQQLVSSLARLIERRSDFYAQKVSSEQSWVTESWAQFSEMGLLGLPFPEGAGGFGWSATDMIGIMEALGTALMVEPYLSTVVLAGRLIARAGSASQLALLLPQIMAGKLQMALAHSEEDADYELGFVATEAERNEEGWILDGKKIAVLHAPSAAKLIVSAREVSRDGFTLFLVNADAPGVQMRRYQTFDHTPAADVELTKVSIAEDAVIGTIGGALELIEEATDFATALLACEAVGIIQFAANQTFEYLKMRKQFGVSLGSFQALQHRAVDMMIALEQARSIALLACVAVDGESNPFKRGRAVSAAKIKIADTCRLIRHESVQLHGAIGMTDDLKLSHAFRRMTAIGQQFGDIGFHLDRFARLDDRVYRCEAAAASLGD